MIIKIFYRLIILILGSFLILGTPIAIGFIGDWEKNKIEADLKKEFLGDN